MMEEFWQGRRVLVTGATGFTGRRLIDRLLEVGAKPRAFVRDAATHKLPADVEICVGDLTREEDCRGAVLDMDTVIHAAAVFRTVNVTAKYMRDVHVGSTRWLMEAGKAAGIRRFVHISTIGVHSSSPMHAAEDCRFAPGDDYQATKLEGELLANSLADELDLPTTIVRPCMIYGAGDTRLLKFMKPLMNGYYFMVGPCKTHLHFVHVADLVEGILLSAERDEAIGQTYFIGGEGSVPLDSWAKMILKHSNRKPIRIRIPYRPLYLAGWACEKIFSALPMEPPLHRRRVAFFANNRSFSIDKARRELGFVPRVDLEDGMGELAEWFRTQGYV